MVVSHIVVSLHSHTKAKDPVTAQHTEGYAVGKRLRHMIMVNEHNFMLKTTSPFSNRMPISPSRMYAISLYPAGPA